MQKYTKRRLINCGKAALLGGLMGCVSLITNAEFALFYPLVGAISGFLTGVFELFIYKEWLRKTNFLVGLIIKSVSYSLTVYVVMLFFLSVFVAISGDLSVQSTMRQFMNREFTQVMFETYKSSIFIVFLFQLDDLLGDGVFRKYLSGRYQKPREQEMIFMFLDIKSSTTVAEKLGDQQYYSFIDDFFHDLSRPILECDAEIYKYVGDEVIIMWPAKKGLADNNCIELFRKIKKRMASKKSKYIDRYGLYPEFKAGMHIGKVITAIIGDIRKEIVYNGDVLNTTARLEEICNAYDAELLISDVLKRQLLPDPTLRIQSLGKIQLKGKHTALHIHSVLEESEYQQGLFSGLAIQDEA